MAANVFGNDLIECSADPLTGYYRNGKCDTCGEDLGRHTMCALMSEEFLAFSVRRGNDLITPMPQFNFPGLKSGDYWCVCMGRWLEAHKAGCAPKVKLDATHISVLEFIDLEMLQSYAVV